MPETRIRLTITVTREYNVDYDDYTVYDDGDEVGKKLTREEAKARDIECVESDPFSFIDAADAKVVATIEELGEA